MDIKDFILISGGMLIMLVVAHGFWIAYRAKREPYRIDIVPDLVSEDVDDMERLRGELPNGGSRVLRRIDAALIPEQDALDLQAPADGTPTLMDVASSVTGEVRERISEKVRKPRVFQAPPRPTELQDTLPLEDDDRRQPENTRREPSLVEPVHRSSDAQEKRRSAEPQTLAAKAAEEEAGPNHPHGKTTRMGTEVDSDDGVRVRQAPTTPSRVAGVKLMTERRPQHRSSASVGAGSSQNAQPVLDGAGEGTLARHKDREGPELDRTVQELLIVNVVACRGHKFCGEDIVRALRGQGLRYGDMNIFHRLDAMSKAKQFSVANMLEPGHFDLSDLAGMGSPGMSFFLQLPGPEDATDAFSDMIATAQQVALQLGGELRDEQMRAMTGQAQEHMRQRIAEFARRKLSIRA